MAVSVWLRPIAAAGRLGWPELPGFLRLAAGFARIGVTGAVSEGLTDRRLTTLLPLIGLSLLALAVRLPLLADVPRFTDETDDMLIAASLARGHGVPLVNASSYIGVLLTYLVAPVFKLVGPRLEAARLVVAVLGVVALVPTYLLGRRLGGHWAGLIAAALLASSAPHIMATSRIAWSHSLTPLFATLAIWLLMRAVEQRHGPSLAAAGLAAGLAVNTHPTVGVLMLGGLLYLLLQGRSLLRSRWSALAAAGFVLSNANLLAYNLLTRGESASFARWVWVQYSDRDQVSYWGALSQLLATAANLLGGSLTDRFAAAWPLPLPEPILLGLTGASLVFCAARGQTLPLLVVASSTLLFPTFLTRYEPVTYNGRYIMPLLPICLATLGASLVALAQGGSDAGAGFRRGLVGVLVLAVAGWHLAAVAGFIRSSVEQGLTNQRYYWAESILSAESPADEVLLDAALVGRGTGGGGDLLKQFRYLLETHDRPYRIVDRPARPPDVGGQTRTVVLRSAALAEFTADIGLAPLLEAVDSPRGANFGIYRVSYPPVR